MPELTEDQKNMMRAAALEGRILYENALEQSETMEATRLDCSSRLIMMALWECATAYLLATGWPPEVMIAKLAKAAAT